MKRVVRRSALAQQWRQVWPVDLTSQTAVTHQRSGGQASGIKSGTSSFEPLPQSAVLPGQPRCAVLRAPLPGQALLQLRKHHCDPPQTPGHLPPALLGQTREAHRAGASGWPRRCSGGGSSNTRNQHRCSRSRAPAGCSIAMVAGGPARLGDCRRASARQRGRGRTPSSLALEFPVCQSASVNFGFSTKRYAELGPVQGSTH